MTISPGHSDEIQTETYLLGDYTAPAYKLYSAVIEGEAVWSTTRLDNGASEPPAELLELLDALDW